MKRCVEVFLSKLKSFICFSTLILFLSNEMKHMLTIHFITIFHNQKLEKHYGQKYRSVLISIISMTVFFLVLIIIYFRMLSNRMACNRWKKQLYKHAY